MLKWQVSEFKKIENDYKIVDEIGGVIVLFYGEDSSYTIYLHPYLSERCLGNITASDLKKWLYLCSEAFDIPKEEVDKVWIGI